MRDAQLEHERQVLREAFTAGWQAALGMRIRDPRVLAVVDSCFELWLQEAVDEADVLGLVFRGRYDLPSPDERSAARMRGPAPEIPPQGRHAGLRSGGNRAG